MMQPGWIWDGEGGNRSLQECVVYGASSRLHWIVLISSQRNKYGMGKKGLQASAFGLALLLFIVAPSIAQDGASGNTKNKNGDSKRETVAKPLTEKQRKKKEAQLKKELETPWKKWLNEDVTYIITDEERKAFKRLNTDEEREQFVEQFWLRRDPTPDTVENEYKEEHYRRIAYANEHYASGIPGWKTDRGRIYITFGPPDEIESHPSGGTYERPAAEGGGETSTYPFEDWRYRYIEGIGNDVNHRVRRPHHDGRVSHDDGSVGKGRSAVCPERRFDAGRADGPERQDGALPAERTERTSGRRWAERRPAMNEFNRLEQFAKLQRPPEVKFKDLEAVDHYAHHVTTFCRCRCAWITCGSPKSRCSQTSRSSLKTGICSSRRRTACRNP